MTFAGRRFMEERSTTGTGGALAGLPANTQGAELDRYQSLVTPGYYAGGTTYTDDTYYDPARDYRDGNYQEREVAANERVYRGTDGRYYCKRSDGTTGLIVGGLAGGVLGNVIAGGGSRLLGTVIGGAGGALLGQSVDRGQVVCR